jgi:gluconolactonase
MNPTLREIARGLRFPEGPIALPDGDVLVVEIERGCLSRITADGTVTPVAFTGGGPNGAAIGPDGQCYVCNNGGFAWLEDSHGLRPGGQAEYYRTGSIQRVHLQTGAVETLYEGSEHGRLCGPNDLAFDRAGGMWFTDRGKTREADMDKGAIYYARTDGSFIRRVVFPFISPNGIALSPNEDKLYVAETIGGRLWAYDITGPGELSHEPWPLSPNGGRLMAGSGERFRMFDSMAVDSLGNVVVATLMDGGLTVVPAQGGPQHFILMPEPMPTNLCFGGPDLRTAYITLSCTGRLVAMDWPCPGAKLPFLNL